MKTIKRVLSWVAFNVFVSALAYFGMFGGIDGAYYLFAFINVIMFLFACVMQHDIVTKAAANKNLLTESDLYYRIDVAFDFLLTAAIVWSGHWVVGTIYLMHSLLLIMFRQKVRKFIAATPTTSEEVTP